MADPRTHCFVSLDPVVLSPKKREVGRMPTDATWRKGSGPSECGAVVLQPSWKPSMADARCGL